MKFSQKLNLLRTDRGWTMQELANRSELSKGYISMLEKGENPQTKKPIIVSLETAQKLASAFNLEIEDFLEDVEDNISLPELNLSNSVNHHNLPFFNMYAALNSDRKDKVQKFTRKEYLTQVMQTGEGLEILDDRSFPGKESIIIGRKSAAGNSIEVDDDLAKQEVVSSTMIPKGADELVEITGDSMEPLIHKGEKVYIRHQPDVENGEIAIIRIDEQGVTCKRVYKENSKLILKSENKKYKDIIIEKDEAVILAKVLSQ